MVGGWWDSNIYLYRNREGYEPLGSIDLGQLHVFGHDLDWINHISFLSDDIVMVVADEGEIFLVSLQSGKCISHCNLQKSNHLQHAAVLSDGRVCVGGVDGYCAIFKPSEETEDIIGYYAQRMNHVFNTGLFD